MSHEELSAHSREVVKRWLRGDIEALADDAEIWSIGLYEDESGKMSVRPWGPQTKQGILALLGQFASAPSPYRIKPTEWTVDGNRVAVEARGHTILENGAQYENFYHLAYVVEGEHIVKCHHYFDTALFERSFFN